ncbi:MAG: DUF1987 domain-containing protein [Bacteroidales bacterium]|nr:DUF1987 domain-containing protein [Bacteroidales bacterium]
MNDIHIEPCKDNFIRPQVDFVASTGLCEISGESFLEEVAQFYNPLVDWIRNYSNMATNIKFVCKLTYFNTSTSKWLLTILSELKKAEDKGVKIEVDWFFHADDVDMRDDISDYMYDTGLHINLVPFE